MKKLLLLFTVLFTLNGFAQDWAPFKTTDTLKHFHSNYTLNSQELSQIQSVSVDSSFNTSTAAIKILKRGISLAAFTPSSYKQMIKGQVLGDTLNIYNDSSVVKTIDQYGYALFFPHQYKMAQFFKIGHSNNGRLIATVDSMSSDSINGSIDSLVRLKIRAFDLSNTPDYSNHFDSSVVVISKNYGIIKTPDFTNLVGFQSTGQHFFLRNFYTNREKFSLTKGEEWHYTVDSTIPSNVFHHNVRVIHDTVINSIRTLKMQHLSKLAFGFSTYRGLTVDTFYYSFKDNEVAYNMNSLLLEDTFQIWQSYNINIGYYKKCNPCFSSDIVYSEEFISVYSSNFGVKSDSAVVNSGLTGELSDYYMGVDSNYTRWGNNGVGADRQTKTIVYVKKGNQTWGTPLNLAIGVPEIKQLDERLSLYPNPVNEKVYLKTELKIQSIEVYDFQGKLIQVSGIQKLLDVSGLEAGIYFININTDKGVITEKFLKS